MKFARLSDGTSVACLLSTEATVLDHHVDGYFQHGIAVGDGGVVFDVGANVGVFGVRALQRGPSVQVYAFEPVPTIYACLAENARTTDPKRFHTFAVGVSDRAAEVDFTYYPNSPALSTARPEQWSLDVLERAVEGSLRNPPPHMAWTRWLPTWLGRLFARRMRQQAEVFRCPLVTLSSVIDQHGIERIDLLKIDCEGAEIDALRGLEPRHWPCVQQVVVEVHDRGGALQTAQDLLRQMGLVHQVVEQEAALRETPLYNIFARRGT